MPLSTLSSSMLAFDSGALSYRNRIINGSFSVDQRNSGASVSTGLAANTYTADRWIVNATGAALTAQRTGSASGGNLALTVTGAASNTGAAIKQRIEALNVYDLAGKNVTISFTASASALTSVTVGVGYASAVDSFTTVTSIGTSAVAISSTAARYTATFTLPSSAKNGVELSFTVGAMTSGTFTLSEVQLEEGLVATPFERKLYSGELALCQRYYQEMTYVYGSRHETVVSYATAPYKVNMRVAPAVTASYSAGNSLHVAQADCVIFKAAAGSNVQASAITLAAEL